MEGDGDPGGLGLRGEPLLVLMSTTNSQKWTPNLQAMGAGEEGSGLNRGPAGRRMVLSAHSHRPPPRRCDISTHKGHVKKSESFSHVVLCKREPEVMVVTGDDDPKRGLRFALCTRADRCVGCLLAFPPPRFRADTGSPGR